MKKSGSARKFTGLAGAAAVAGASQAYGAIVTIPTPANIVGNNPANTSATPTRRTIDLDGNGTLDLQLAYRSFTTGAYAIQQSFIYAYTTGAVAGQAASATSFYASEVYTGATLPGAYTFGSSGTNLVHIATHVNANDYGFWYLGDHNFVGFSFLNSTTNQTNYGYVELETDAYVSAADPGGLKFFSLKYENSGAAIVTPALVPEPSSLAALAFGGAGVAAAAYRRKRASAAV